MAITLRTRRTRGRSRGKPPDQREAAGLVADASTVASAASLTIAHGDPPTCVKEVSVRRACTSSQQYLRAPLMPISTGISCCRTKVMRVWGFAIGFDDTDFCVWHCNLDGLRRPFPGSLSRICGPAGWRRGGGGGVSRRQDTCTLYL